MNPTMKTAFLTIPGPKGGVIWDNHDGSFTWTAAAMDDSDGSGSLHGDPDGQKSTSLRDNGHSLNADVNHYTVVPEQFPKMVRGIVLGCKAMVVNHSTGLVDYHAVVGDLGPRNKLGEYSNVVNETIGLSGSPLYGGTDQHVVECTIWPGVVAEGYTLQHI